MILNETRPPSAAANAGIGGDSWVDPTNVYASDDARATVSITISESDYLRVTGFGFAAASIATEIQGVTVDIEWSGTTQNYAVFLVWDATQKGTSKTGTPPASESVTTLGSSSDLWGATFVAGANGDVLKSSFGVDIRVSGFGLTSAAIDAVTITVTYFAPVDPIHLNMAWQNNQTVILRRKPEMIASD